MNIRTLQKTTKFKKDFKIYKRNQKVIERLEEVGNLLIHKQPIPEKYHPHPLSGQYKDCMDCHLFPDVVLIYSVTNDTAVLHRIGQHNKLELTETATNPIKLHLKELDEN